MSVKIRMTRVGRQRSPYYRMVVADARHARDGRVIEYVGRYQPLQPNDNLFIEEERVMYWLGKGAIPSGTVRELLRRVGLMRRFHETRFGPTVAPGHEQYHVKKERAPEPTPAEKAAKARAAQEAAKAEEAAKVAAEAKAVADAEAAEAAAKLQAEQASAAEAAAAAPAPSAENTEVAPAVEPAPEQAQQ
jgi:small subunit ribosomal protein S16